MITTVLSSVRQCKSGAMTVARAQASCTRRYASNDYFKVVTDKQYEEKSMMPYKHMAEMPGKKSRFRLVQAYNHWLQVPDDKVDEVEKVCELVHNYIILMDDLEDGSKLRRGVPVSHSVFGVPSTLNSMFYSAFLTLKKCSELHPKAADVLIDNMINVHLSHGIEMYWRDNFMCPTFEEWENMILEKLGGIVNTPFRLLELFSDKKVNIRKLTDAYALYCQLKDDYTDLMSADRFEYKLYGDDIAEGKMSYPIMHAIKQKGGEKVLYMLRQKPQDVEMRKYCISVIKDLGSLDFTLKALRKTTNDLKNEIKNLGGNPIFEEMIDEYSYLFN